MSWATFCITGHDFAQSLASHRQNFSTEAAAILRRATRSGRGLTQQHGGRIPVDSKVGEYSEFTKWLPRNP
jgi:hypothetical protein